MVRNNTISFSYKEQDYRVRLLNQKEKDELDLFRRKKFGELMKDKNILFEKELIELYKEKGIDIEKDIDDKINKTMVEVKNKKLKLGEALEKNEDDSILKVYSDEIEELLEEASGLVVQKSNLLENSFEKTLEEQVIKYLAYLSLEMKMEDKYVKAFLNIDDFTAIYLRIVFRLKRIKYWIYYIPCFFVEIQVHIFII